MIGVGTVTTKLLEAAAAIATERNEVKKGGKRPFTPPPKAIPGDAAGPETTLVVDTPPAPTQITRPTHQNFPEEVKAVIDIFQIRDGLERLVLGFVTARNEAEANLRRLDAELEEKLEEIRLMYADLKRPFETNIKVVDQNLQDLSPHETWVKKQCQL